MKKTLCYAFRPDFKKYLHAGALLLFLLFCGCISDDVTIVRTSPDRRYEYNNNIVPFRNELLPETVNVLSNFLLNELLEKQPEQLLEKLEKLYLNEPLPVYMETLADCSLSLGRRFVSDPERSARFHLSAVLYSYSYLIQLDKQTTFYDPSRLSMLRIYNQALTELFSYLSAKNLTRRGGYELTAAAGQVIFFEMPDYRMPVKQELVKEILLCADYRPVNLTHVSRRFGIGAPLILTLDPKTKKRENYAGSMAFPGTAVLDFNRLLTEKSSQRYTCRLIYADSRNADSILINTKKIPLEQDLSTPLAYMAKDPPLYNFLFYMLRPDDTREMQGLYHFEPFDPNRIPVVLVHGLMSDTRTWLQMINSLRSDPVFLKHFQVYGFSYSSGMPIVHSAFFLRDALIKEREQIIKRGYSTENFDKMVLVGHSMGGLLSRMAISDTGTFIEDYLAEKTEAKLQDLISDLSKDEQQRLLSMVCFKPLPFVKRVVFIAVPHKGSQMAKTWIGRFGAWCIQLPKNLIRFRQSRTYRRFTALIGKKDLNNTGIDNLDPENEAILFLNSIQMSKETPFHSIIGNQKEEGCPGGSDGIVPYASSHLDHARSELVVKSGHSAQKNPLAIQELRRILYQHLKEHNRLDTKIK